MQRRIFTWKHILFISFVSALMLTGLIAKAHWHIRVAEEKEESFKLQIVVCATDFVAHEYPDDVVERRATSFCVQAAHWEEAVACMKNLGYDVRIAKIEGMPPGIEFEGPANTFGGGGNDLPHGRYFTIVSRDVLFRSMKVDVPEGRVHMEWEHDQDVSDRAKGRYVAEQLAHALLLR